MVQGGRSISITPTSLPLPFPPPTPPFPKQGCGILTYLGYSISGSERKGLKVENR